MWHPMHADISMPRASHFACRLALGACYSHSSAAIFPAQSLLDHDIASAPSMGDTVTVQALVYCKVNSPGEKGTYRAMQAKLDMSRTTHFTLSLTAADSDAIHETRVFTCTGAHSITSRVVQKTYEYAVIVQIGTVSIKIKFASLAAQTRWLTILQYDGSTSCECAASCELMLRT